MSSDIRWKQCFDNFDRTAPVAEGRRASLHLCRWRRRRHQRFEVAFELAWKTINDHLEECVAAVL